MVSSRTSRPSGLSKRNMSAATGVSAAVAPAISAEAGENHLRTVGWVKPTVATPSSAWGTRMLQALTPKTRAERSITQSAAGDLSTVMKFDASKDPKKNAFQLVDPAWTAAE